MDLSVLCSLREGFSNVILESMASGIPVLASNVGGNPEAIVEGVTGFLFEPLNPDELAAKVILLFKDKELRERMGRAGRERAERFFNRNQMAKDYEKIYEQLLSTKEVTAAEGIAVGLENSEHGTNSSTTVHD